jgi:uncharacterized membrane protein HdeD (DUF308 family)
MPRAQGRIGVTAGPARAASRTSSSVLGAILFLLGVLALVFAGVVTIASIVAFGILLAVGGISELFHAFRGQEGERDRFFLSFISGLLTTVVGGVMIFRPEVGVAGSGLVVGAWLLSTGLFRSVTSLVDRYRYWAWDLAYGIVSLLLGVWVIASLPTSAPWLLGTVIAIEFMAHGAAVMLSSFALQRRERSSAPAN